MNNGKYFWRAASWRLYGPAVFIIVAMQGCVPSGTRPDDMSAEAHRSAAAEEQQQATEHLQQYDSEAAVSGQYNYPGDPASSDPSNYNAFYGLYGYGYAYNDFYWDVRSYNPRDHLIASQQLENHAADHLAAAQALEAFEEAECREFPPETRVACPLLGQIESVQDVFGGVSLSFKEGVDVNAAIAHVRCHVAFARTRGRIGMESCPLYVPGVEANRQKNSNVVELTVGDPKQLLDLQQRARGHLDADADSAE